MTADDEAVPARESFRERLRRRQEMFEIVDLDDRDLAERILDGDPRGDATVVYRDELVRRYRDPLLNRSRKACGRMAHRGATCRDRQCTHVLVSAMSAVAEELVGRTVHAVSVVGDWPQTIAAPAPAERKAPGYQLLRKWVPDSDTVPLPERLGKLLYKDGMDTDIRRRWNLDRGLPVRANVPDGVAADWEQRLDTLEQQDSTDPLIELIDRSKPGRNAESWAQYIYDDLCDLPSHDSIAGIDSARLARRVFSDLDDIERDELVASGRAQRLFDQILECFAAAAEDEGSSFVTDHFDAAMAMTRLGLDDRPDYQAERDEYRALQHAETTDALSAAADLDADGWTRFDIDADPDEEDPTND